LKGNYVRKFDWICLVLVQLDMILPDRAYAFFSHTHKAQKENMPLLDKVFLCVHVLVGCDKLMMIILPMLISLCHVGTSSEGVIV